MSKRFIVSVSGGLGSFEALRRCLEQKGHAQTMPVFADVGSVFENGECVSGEDEDLFRFLDDMERLLGVRIERIRSEKYASVWDAFFGERFMGNTRLDTCSKFLKRKVLNEWAAKNHPGATWVIGYSWLELARIELYRKWVPNSWFPNAERPYVTSEDISEWLVEHGVQPPRAYAEGFLHNNCGGMCVKSGLGQVYDLWRRRPRRYAFNERKELQFRAEINASATIYRYQKRPITMEALRLKFEGGYVPKTAGQTGCAGQCMLPFN